MCTCICMFIYVYVVKFQNGGIKRVSVINVDFLKTPGVLGKCCYPYTAAL